MLGVKSIVVRLFVDPDIDRLIESKSKYEFKVLNYSEVPFMKVMASVDSLL